MLNSKSRLFAGAVALSLCALAVPANDIRWQREKALFRCVESLPVRFGPDERGQSSLAS